MHDRMCVMNKGTFTRLSYNTNDGTDTKWNQYGGTGITLNEDMRVRKANMVSAEIQTNYEDGPGPRSVEKLVLLPYSYQPTVLVTTQMEYIQYGVNKHATSKTTKILNILMTMPYSSETFASFWEIYVIMATTWSWEWMPTTMSETLR